RVIDRLEPELNAVAVPGGADVDLASQCSADDVADLRDRGLLIGVKRRPALRAARAPPVALGCGPGSRLELAHRPSTGSGGAGQAAAQRLILGEQQSATVTLAELAPLDQLERLVGEFEQ